MESVDSKISLESLSARISAMSLICAAFVVGLHVGEGPAWLRKVTAVKSIAVPVFFTIAGFLFAGRMDEQGWWKRQVLSRVRSLMIPYVIWNLAYWIFMFGIGLIAVKCGRDFGGLDNVNAMMWNKYDVLGFFPLMFPALGLTWFIRSLFIMALISPVFAVCKQKWGWAFVLISYASMCVAEQYCPEFGRGWMEKWLLVGWLRALSYFSVGIYLRYNGGNSVGAKVPRLVAVAMFVVAAASFSLDFPGRVFFATPLAIVGLWYMLRSVSLPTTMTSCAFPIYLIHSFVGVVLSGVGSAIVLAPTATWWMTRFVLMFLGSLIVAMAIKRVVPTISRLIFGGR